MSADGIVADLVGNGDHEQETGNLKALTSDLVISSHLKPYPIGIVLKIGF